MDRLTTMEAFVRVADAGSFSGAARQWAVSKAVVSKYVAALEARLGVALLMRTTRSVALTDAGRDYYDRCVALLGEVDALDASVRAEALDVRGTLRFTAPPGFLARYAPLLLSEFRARYPRIDLDIHLTHRMVDLVEEGFDLAVRVTAPRDSALIVRWLAPSPLVLVGAPGYLAKYGAPKSVRELAHHACLVDTNFRERGRWRFEVDGEVVHVEVDGPFRVNSPLVVRDLAAEGHGLALIPEFVVDEALASGDLVAVEGFVPAFDWSIYAVYPRRKYIPARVKVFVDHLAEALSGQSSKAPVR